MGRLNLTLDDDTLTALHRHAKQEGTRTAAFAKGLLRKALDDQEALERARKLARDYAAGRDDAAKLLAELHSGGTALHI